MIPKDYSPFTPGQPVPVEFFVGRQPLVEALAAKARASVDGRVQIAFVSGERGIGKSSLMSFLRVLVERDSGMFSAQVFLGGVATLEEAMRRIMLQLIRDCADKSWFDQIKSLFGDRIKRVGLFGTSIDFEAKKGDLENLKLDFAGALRELIARFPAERQSLLLVLDDINGLAEKPEFANWLKSFVDGVATSGKKLPLMLVLVGLEERRIALIDQQRSLDRILDTRTVGVWTKDETERFFVDTFAKVEIEVSAEALHLLQFYAGGLPVLAHEIGDATFRINLDRKIDKADALSGVVAAADIVGRKYLQPKVFEAIRSKNYRTILRKISHDFDGQSFSRAKLMKKFTGAESKVLDNFLRKMMELGVIEREKEEGPGAYRFCSVLHQLYFEFEALHTSGD
jgi:hypothetical protein